MSRDRDMDALTEALQRAQDGEPSRLARWGRRVLLNMAAFVVSAVVGGVLLGGAGVDLGWLRLAMLYGSPVLAVGVVRFIVHAWRQNDTSPIDGAGQVGQAEPGQVVAEVGQVGQPALDAEVARPVTAPATVTVTILPIPLTALPQAATPIRYATFDAEEETSA